MFSGSPIPPLECPLLTVLLQKSDGAYIHSNLLQFVLQQLQARELLQLGLTCSLAREAVAAFFAKTLASLPFQTERAFSDIEYCTTISCAAAPVAVDAVAVLLLLLLLLLLLIMVLLALLLWPLQLLLWLFLLLLPQLLLLLFLLQLLLLLALLVLLPLLLLPVFLGLLLLLFSSAAVVVCYWLYYACGCLPLCY